MKAKTLILATSIGVAFLLTVLTTWLVASRFVTAPGTGARGLPPAVPATAKAQALANVPDGSLAQAIKEKEVLQNLVARLRQDQQRRDAARELLKDELARLGTQSRTLDEQLAIMNQPDQPLSDDERMLVKDVRVPLVAPTVEPMQSPANTVAIVAPSEIASQSESSVQTQAVPARDVPSAPVDNAASNPLIATAPRPEVVFNPPVSAGLVPLAREAKDDFDKGRYAEAGKIYAKLLAQEPKNSYLLSSQGLVLLRQGNLKEAEVLVRKATAISPRDPFALATLGIVYFRMQQYNEAIATLTQAIQLDPRNAVAHNYLGITSSQKGWPEAAIDEVQKAIALNPNYAEAHFNLAVIYATSQPPAKDRAEEHYKIATSLGAASDHALEKLLKN